MMENFEGVPMLEICERPLVWTGEEPPSMLQAYKGRSTVKHSHQGAPLYGHSAVRWHHCMGMGGRSNTAVRGHHCMDRGGPSMLQAYKGRSNTAVRGHHCIDRGGISINASGLHM